MARSRTSSRGMLAAGASEGARMSLPVPALSTARFGPLSERSVCSYTKQILKALHYLHYNRIIHRWAWPEHAGGAYS